VKLFGDPFDPKGQDRQQHAALQRLANFAFLTTRQLFYRPEHHEMTWLEANQHNEWTMCLFITFLHSVISATTGSHFAVSTIETYAAKVVTAP